MHAEIVTTGTELLLGVITDTNSTYMARCFRDIGLNLYFITSAGDNQERVAQVIDAALDRYDVVITTGGLGPTVDDVTREAVAQATGRELVHSAELEASIEAFFHKRGYHMSDNNRRQARIPEGAMPLENPVGTAPCFVVEDARGIVISLPGVPREMRYMMEHTVLPYLREKLHLRQIIKARTLKTCGIGESSLDARIADLEESPNPTIGLAAHPGQSDIRITAKADSEKEADAMLDDVEAQIRARVDDVIFGVDDDKLESVVLALLQGQGRSIAVAEAGSGGLLSGWLSEADLEGRTFRGAWVLPGDPPWGCLGEGEPDLDLRQETRRVAERVCHLSGAGVGVAVVNRGPEQTMIAVSFEGRVYERVMPFRGHERHTQNWIATTALDVVRRLGLGLALSS